PRHPERGPDLARDLRARGWRLALRSAGDPRERDTEIYLADTLGELGLWYRLAPVSFVGGSLVPVGGHNPYEPAMLGSAILHGPMIGNFEAAYQRFSAAGATVSVSDAGALAPRAIETLAPDRAAALAAAAWRVTSEGADVAGRFAGLLLADLARRAD
ncbi:MAG: 3-deoxy-D-manno-octulosonic acid transferase, partial [Pseudomonadota bacterium]